MTVENGKPKKCGPCSGNGGGGTSDSEIVQVNFAYDTPSPFTLTSVSAGDSIIDTELEIETEFDDPLAALQVGTFADLGLIIPTGFNNPQECGNYGNQENFSFTMSETVILTIAAGTSTQGSGRVTMLIKRA